MRGRVPSQLNVRDSLRFSRPPNLSAAGPSRGFAGHPSQTLSRQELLSMAWGIDYDPQTNLVDVYVGYLRRKLGEPVIETIRGAGYRLRTDRYSASPP